MSPARLIAAFHAGETCAQNDGYLADNPHEWGSELWEAWRAGFEYDEGPRYAVNPSRSTNPQPS